MLHVQPLPVMSITEPLITKPGRLQAGVTEFPFSVQLCSQVNRPLYDTYHGVHIAIQVDNLSTIQQVFLYSMCSGVMSNEHSQIVMSLNKLNFMSNRRCVMIMLAIVSN